MVGLRERYYGCIASTWIGSSMGAAVEGWEWRRIEQAYGRLAELLPYEHYDNGWMRPPGTTEDGIERQKLFAEAIIERGGRVTAADVVGVWKRLLDPEKVMHKQEAFDVALLELARAGTPHSMIGTMWPHPNVNSVARAAHPIGLINAADPERAAADTFDVGRLYAYDNVPALRWAALYNAGIAAACAPDATIDTVVETMRSFASYRRDAAGLYGRYDTIADELDRAIEIARRHHDYRAFRDEFDTIYHGGSHVVYSLSQANEIICKGVALFVFSEAVPEQTIVNAVNLGRDTDCIAAVSGGLSGALSGGSGLPDEWVQRVDEATSQDPYTCVHRSIGETANLLYDAFLSRRARLEEYLRTTGADGYLTR
ncbi:MAG: ADP-ribosylglycohydrolase family protein [Spirochaetota bacterium]